MPTKYFTAIADTSKAYSSAKTASIKTATWNLNGGTLQSGFDNPFTDIMYPNPLPTATYEGFTFDGWFTDNTYTTLITAGMDIGTYTNAYAKFTKSISYNLDGGVNNVLNPTIISSYDISTGKMLYAPIKVDYEPYIEYDFEGWYTESTFENKITTLAGLGSASTLYAKFSPKEIYQNSVKLENGTAKDLAMDAKTVDGGYSPYLNINGSTLDLMSDLKEAVDYLNTNNKHAIFDFSAFIQNGYVCLVEMSDTYCYVKDLLNKKVYGNNSGYSGSTTVAAYMASCTVRDDYQNIKVHDLTTMGDLRTFIDGVNTKGEHCFFDFSEYIDGAYVCTVQMYTTQSAIKYCFVFDILNGKLYGEYSGYNDSTTIANYCQGTVSDLTHAIKITDNTTTVQDIITMINQVNLLGHHVFLDVGAISDRDYLITFTYETTDTNTTIKFVGLVKGCFGSKTVANTELSSTTLVSLLNDAIDMSSSYYAYKITSQSTTLGDMKNINDGINARGEHVFYDVYQLGANTYVCTFYTDGVTYTIMDLVSQRCIRGNYDANKLLSMALTGADYIATQSQINNLQEQIDELGGKKVIENWEALGNLIESGESTNVINAGDTINVNWIKSVLGTTTSGLTVACNDMNKFITGLGKAEEDTYYFVYNGTSWTYNDTQIDISQWGLVVSGDIPTGEVMTIVTTVDKINYTFTGYDDVENNDGATHSWLLEQTYCPTTKAYDTYESLFNVLAGQTLNAGKYKATLRNFYHGIDVTFYVTLPNNITATTKKIQMGSTGYKQVMLSGANKYVVKGIRPYEIDSTVPLETEITCYYDDTVTDPDTYTDLSTLSSIVELPASMDKAFFGSNTWPESNIRTWLNSNKDGEYVAPYEFDRPSAYNTGKGFLWGIDPRVLKVMLTANVKWTAGYGNKNYTQGTTYTSEDKVFLLSMKEMSFNINTNEGNVTDLYDEYIIDEKGSSQLTNDAVAERSKYNQAGGTKNSYRWSRSAYTGSAIVSWGVSAAGSGDGSDAVGGIYFAPAFIIGKSSQNQ